MKIREIVHQAVTIREINHQVETFREIIPQVEMPEGRFRMKLAQDFLPKFATISRMEIANGAINATDSI